MHRSLVCLRPVGSKFPVEGITYRKGYHCHYSTPYRGGSDYVKPVRGYIDSLPSQISNRRHLPVFLEQQKRRDAIIEERGGVETPEAEAAAMTAVPSFTHRLSSREKAVVFRQAIEAGGAHTFGRNMGCTGSSEDLTESYNAFMRDTYGVELDSVHHYQQAGASSATYYPNGCPSLGNSGTLGPKARLNLRDDSSSPSVTIKKISPEDIDAPAVQQLSDQNLDAMVEEMFLREEDVSPIGLTR